jgi:hypothetical protein
MLRSSFEALELLVVEISLNDPRRELLATAPKRVTDSAREPSAEREREQIPARLSLP